MSSLILLHIFEAPLPLVFTVDGTLNLIVVQQQEPIRQIAAADWVAHLPLLYGVIALTIVIDAIFIAMIFRNRRKNRRAL